MKKKNENKEKKKINFIKEKLERLKSLNLIEWRRNEFYGFVAL